MLKTSSIIPGMIAAILCASIAIAIDAMIGLPAIIAALFIGLAFQRLVAGPVYQPGLDLVAKRILRIGVALLGVRISFSDISALGAGPVIMVVLLTAATLGFGLLVARILGLRVQLGFVTGGAVAICGASAAIALSSILKQEKTVERDTMFTIIAVTALSTIAMVVYPLLFSWMGLSDQQSGILIGATIHDVAQVVGAGYAISEDAGDIATYVKLLRVCLLPVVLIAALAVIRMRRNGGGEKAVKNQFPLFVLAFAALVIANSFGIIAADLATLISDAAQWLLVAALAALGLRTALGAFRGIGAVYIGLIVLETVFLLGLGLAATGLFNLVTS